VAVTRPAASPPTLHPVLEEFARGLGELIAHVMLTSRQAEGRRSPGAEEPAEMTTPSPGSPAARILKP
jgi:hypothetical protein